MYKCLSFKAIFWKSVATQVVEQWVRERAPLLFLNRKLSQLRIFTSTFNRTWRFTQAEFAKVTQRIAMALKRQRNHCYVNFILHFNNIIYYSLKYNIIHYSLYFIKSLKSAKVKKLIFVLIATVFQSIRANLNITRNSWNGFISFCIIFALY